MMLSEYAKSAYLSLLLVVAVLSLLASFVKSEGIELYGLNYNTRQGPDWDPFRCKTYEQVHLELSILSQITNRIRLLSLIDCNQGPIVLDAAADLGMELWLGLWVTNITHVFPDELNALRWMIDQGMLHTDNQTHTNPVKAITVGSEAVYREEVTAEEIVSYKQNVSDVLLNAGLGHIPVGICDVDDTYEANIELFEGTDIVVANAFPFWERTPVDQAVDFFVDSKWPPILNLANWQQKEVVIGETGWASAGQNPAASDATPHNQATYLRDFYCQIDRELGWKYFYFTGIDNTWRQEQEYWHDDWVEGHFGLFHSNMTLKSHFADLQFTCPGSDTVYRFEINEVPTAAPTNAPPEACSANPACDALGLVGNCCPAPNGLILGCCDDNTILNNSPTATLLSLDPTVTPADDTEPANPTTTPTLFPTFVPTTTVAPVVSLPTEEPSGTGAPSETGDTDNPTISPSSIVLETSLTSLSPSIEAELTSTPSIEAELTTTPSALPSVYPTTAATTITTTYPTLSPTSQDDMTDSPTLIPSPTGNPTSFPTGGPTSFPTTVLSTPVPTMLFSSPSSSPSTSPSTSPSSSPSSSPSTSPSSSPSSTSPSTPIEEPPTPSNVATDSPSVSPPTSRVPSLSSGQTEDDVSSFSPSGRPIVPLNSASAEREGSSAPPSRKMVMMTAFALFGFMVYGLIL